MGLCLDYRRCGAVFGGAFSSVRVRDWLRGRVLFHGGYRLHGCLVAAYWTHGHNFLFFDAFASIVPNRAYWHNFLFFDASTLVAAHWTNWPNFLFFDDAAPVAISDGSNGSAGAYKSTTVATDGSLR